MKRAMRTRRGVAMLLVLSAIGVASILGVAMLTTAMLQNCTGRNATSAISADALAESGIDVACYYLLYPEEAPAFSGDFWPGQSGISFGADVSGVADVSVSLVSKTATTATCAITSVGRTSSGLSRQETCTILVNPGFRVKRGMAFAASSLTIPTGSVVKSDIQVAGSGTNYGSVTGNVIVTSWTNLGTWSGSQTPAAEKTSIPPNANIRDYSTYTYRGQTYSATALTGLLAPGTVLGPTPTNPAGIYRQGGQLEIQGNVIINGTLIVAGGPLKITGGGIQVKPAKGFPAAVIKGDLQLVHSKLWTPEITFTGLVWLAGNIKSPLSGSGPTTRGVLQVNGALLSPSGNIDVPFRGCVNVTHQPNTVAGIDLDTTVLPPGIFFKLFK